MRLHVQGSSRCNSPIRRISASPASQKPGRVRSADAAGSVCGRLPTDGQRIAVVDDRFVLIACILMSSPSGLSFFNVGLPILARRSIACRVDHTHLWRRRAVARSAARSDCDGRPSVCSTVQACARHGSKSALFSISTSARGSGRASRHHAVFGMAISLPERLGNPVVWLFGCPGHPAPVDSPTDRCMHAGRTHACA